MKNRILAIIDSDEFKNTFRFDFPIDIDKILSYTTINDCILDCRQKLDHYTNNNTHTRYSEHIIALQCTRIKQLEFIQSKLNA